MTQILVTGSSGQLGRSIQKQAAQYPELSFLFTHKADLDITRGDAVNRFFSDNQFDYCINCAAFTNVEQAEKSPDIAFEVNETGVANLAKACKTSQVILIHISTDYVFDGLKTTAYDVEDEPNPINEYGKSKWAGEKEIQKILDRYFIIRTSWLYSDSGSNFYTKILLMAREKKTIHVTTEQRGCPTHADHLAHYILDLISGDKKSFGIHHYTDGKAMTWYDFAHEILSKHGLLNEVELVASTSFQALAKRPANSVLIP